MVELGPATEEAPALRGIFTDGGGAGMRGVLLCLSGSNGGFTGPCRDSHKQGFYHRLALQASAGGIGLLQVDYRLKGTRCREANVEDAVEAIDWVRQHYPGAPVAIMGHMIGGSNALAAACKRGKFIDGVMSIGAPHTGIPQESDLKKLGSAEVLVTHGSADTKVPPKVAQFIYHRLTQTQRFGTERIKMYAGGTHELVEQEEELTNDTIQWLERCFVDEL